MLVTPETLKVTRSAAKLRKINFDQPLDAPGQGFSAHFELMSYEKHATLCRTFCELLVKTAT